MSHSRRPPGPSEETVWKPTKAQLATARDKRVDDVIASDLDVLFCGINPGLYSGAVGHHFARPGNRFWPALYRSGFTDRPLSPFDERHLLEYGLGITNLVNRTTARADELAADELVAGGRNLARKVRRFRPRAVAVLGLSAYRLAFGRRDARVGAQDWKIANAAVWVLPNPSGLNAHYQLPALVTLFEKLRAAVQDRNG